MERNRRSPSHQVGPNPIERRGAAVRYRHKLARELEGQRRAGRSPAAISHHQQRQDAKQRECDAQGHDNRLHDMNSNKSTVSRTPCGRM